MKIMAVQTGGLTLNCTEQVQPTANVALECGGYEDEAPKNRLCAVVPFPRNAAEYPARSAPQLPGCPLTRGARCHPHAGTGRS